VVFGSWEDFRQCPEPYGLGLRQVGTILVEKDDTLTVAAVLGRHGGKRKAGEQVGNHQLERPTDELGTCRAYILARLRRAAPETTGRGTLGAARPAEYGRRGPLHSPAHRATLITRGWDGHGFGWGTMTNTPIRSGAAVFTAVWLAACGGGVSPSSLNRAIAISYGKIEQVTPVEVSPTGSVAGSVMGGLLGLALSEGHSGGSMALATAGGALAGGLLGHAAQGSRQADRFLIRQTSGGLIDVTTEQRDLEIGDCVSIEQGEHTNLRRVDAIMCDPASRVAHEPSVAAEAQRDANMCHEARQELLSAQGDAAVQAGIARVKAICHS
jgi:outer membrane lipoprotein SlyB